MYYIGLMSGTSTDGVDAGLVEIEPSFRLLATHHVNYPSGVKRDIERRGREKNTPVDKFFQLDVHLGHLFAQAVLELLTQARLDPERVRAIGSHGQTLRHSPQGPDPFTIQIANPAVIAELTGIATVADFRAADIASGGQGAPLTPAFHAALFHSRRSRVIVNVGGIANITSLPADPAEPVLGFDTGPGNCLSDEWIAQQLGRRFDDTARGRRRDG